MVKIEIHGNMLKVIINQQICDIMKVWELKNNSQNTVKMKNETTRNHKMKIGWQKV